MFILKKKIKKKGFTLIELMLVISIGLAISFLSFQAMIKDHENTQAKSAGEQIKKIGESVNTYIVNHYDKLSSLSNADGSATDPGPRTCVTATNSCDITVDTLINDGLLPNGYSNKNIFNSSYSISLKRSGVAPYYVISGLILTNDAWLGANNSVRYDLIGKAMQIAGIDSGTTRDSNSVVNGYSGNWHVDNSTYSSINKKGLLAYQVGFGSNSYSVFLRRDGTLPMTGNLNMSSQNITNAKDITGSGNLNMSGVGYFGSEIRAQNGYGDIISIGGDAVSNDYEIRLTSPKPLTIYSPNVPSAQRQTTTVFSTNGQMLVMGNQLTSGNLATNGLSAMDMPLNWGGIRTRDIAASGSIALLQSGTTGTAGQYSAYINSNGDIYSSNSIRTSGSIEATQDITGNTLTPTKIVNYGDSCTVTGSMAIDSSGKTLVCSADKKMIKSSSVIDFFSKDFAGALPILTTGLISYCSTAGQQQYTTTIKPIQDEVFATSFTTSLMQASVANSPVSGTDYDRRIALIRSGTNCILINNAVCTAQSNVEPGRTANSSCIATLKANQTYNVLWILGNNTEATMGASRFLVQYSRTAL